jgi:hypothetical protein
MIAHRNSNKDDWEDRTAREWLDVFGWKLVEPTADDLKDLDKSMEHDEFWEWTSGRVDFGDAPGTWRRCIRDILLGLAGFVLLTVLFLLVTYLFQ